MGKHRRTIRNDDGQPVRAPREMAWLEPAADNYQEAGRAVPGDHRVGTRRHHLYG